MEICPFYKEETDKRCKHCIFAIEDVMASCKINLVLDKILKQGV